MYIYIYIIYDPPGPLGAHGSAALLFNPAILDISSCCYLRLSAVLMVFLFFWCSVLSFRFFCSVISVHNGLIEAARGHGQARIAVKILHSLKLSGQFCS